MPDPSSTVRIAFLADSHLGFDLPTRPRVERRRRGHDFQANHERALALARKAGVDLVVHGGDLFHRPRVAPSLVLQAFRPLLETARLGIPVFLVPGNHERSRIPHRHLADHPNLHVFHDPGTKMVPVRNIRVAVSGFPYVRRGIRQGFSAALQETNWQNEEGDVRLLCLHHCVEGATVGPSGFTFRNARDVIRCSDLPVNFAAVFSGHIHRQQVLTDDLLGRRLSTPVLYPGSVERTAFAEMDEEKGFLIVEIEANGSGGRLVGHQFCRLPARPMVIRDLSPVNGSDSLWTTTDLEALLENAISGVPRDSVLRIRVHGRIPKEARRLVAAARIRKKSPTEMNVDIVLTEDRTTRRRGSFSRRRSHPGELSAGAEPKQAPSQYQMEFSGD